MAIFRSNIATHLEAMVRTGFLKSQRAYSPLRSPFVSEVSSTKAFETYADMGASPWPTQTGGQDGAQGQDERTGAERNGGIHDGLQVTVLGGEEAAQIVYNKDWTTTIGIYHNAIDDDQTGDLERWANAAGAKFEQHKDFLAFDALRQGGTDTYGNTYNGLSLFNDAHIDRNAQHQTGQDNNFALSLSADPVANFNTVVVAGSKFLDSRGNPVGASHNLLIVPTDLAMDAAQVSQNREFAGTQNRDMNPYAGNVRVLVAPGAYLSATGWYVVDESMEAPVIIQTRMNPQLIIWDDESAGMGIRYFKWEARYTVAYGNWRSIVRGNA